MQTQTHTHTKAHHTVHTKDKIQEALELLNEAAKDKKEEVVGAINTKYEHVREMFVGAAENGQALAKGAGKQLSKTLHAKEREIKQIAGKWDKKVRKNPWAYLGGAALGSLFVGMLLAKK